MFKGNKSKKMAFFAAMTLVGGTFAPYTYAADVTINPSHPPVKNVPRPLTTGAAGGVGTDGADASGNTLTIQDYDYEYNAVYGGAALGTGNAERNTLTIMNSKVLVGYGGAAQNGGNANHNKLVFRSGEVGATMAGGLVNSETGSAEGNSVTVHSGTTSHIYGGYSKKAKARGNIHKNEVVVNGGTIDGKIKGGVIDEVKSTGNVTENTVTINGGTVKDAVYGGAIEKSNSTGTAAGNRVTINAGIVQKDIIGGFVRGKGTLTGNIVTIAGGEIAGEVYAAFSDNSKSVLTNNVVNLGDGKRDLPVNISKFVWVARGRYGATSSGNTLNVKTRAEADSIGGFEKLNFYFKEAIQPKLTLRKSMDLKIASLNDIGVYGSPQTKSGTLIEKERGKIKIKDGVTSATITGDTAEMTLRLDSTEKNLGYTRWIFKGATIAESEGADTWGGRSTAGNTTTGNAITIDSGTHTNVYGGWTTGTGSTAAAERRGDSTRNRVTVSGRAAVSGTVYGGYTDAAGGKATGNSVTVEKNLAAHVVGGAAEGEVSGNIVTIRANAGDVTGGASTGMASGNIVSLANASVSSVTGGAGMTTHDNTVSLEGGAIVSGVVTGGTAADGTGNTLNVRGKNTAQNIAGFQKVTFDAANVAAGATMLNLTGSAMTTLDKSAVDATGSTVRGGVTLLRNANGINLTGYTGGTLKTETDAATEKNISVHKTGDKITDIRYEGWQFAGVTSAVSDGVDAYGGISKAGNTTHDNTITVNGSYTNVYGGHTSGAGTTALADRRGNSTKNSVTITGGTIGTVYGGFTDTVNGTTHDNTVNLGDGTHPLAPGTTIAELYGGNRTVTGNTLNVNTAATVGRIEHFSTVAFKNVSSQLTLTQAGANFDLDAIQADFEATENPATLVHNAAGLNLSHYRKLTSTLSDNDTKETNIEVLESGGKKTDIVRYAYRFRDVTAATSLGTDTWGGRSRAGNSTTGNVITIDSGTHTNVYGGWTTGTGSTAAAERRGDSTKNSVTIKDNAVVTNIFGGFTDVAGGRAERNIVSLKDVTVTGTVTGGRGTVTNDNVIRLRNAKVTGLVTGGAGHGTGNTLAVYYSTGTSEIGDFDGIQNLHFDLEAAPPRGAHTLLKLTAVGGDKHLTGMKIDFHRDGAAQKFAPGDQITLMENTNGRVSLGENVTVQGTDGISRDYTFDVVSEGNTLIGRVAQAAMNEQSKSIVETRAGASAFLNDGADFTAGPGMDAAKKEARAAVQSGSAPYGIWAGMGGGSLRHETGSYVDMRGWNLGIGWARENAVQAGTLTFGPFIEYGRGSYDSYLDDGTHGSGKTGFLGAGVMAKIETKAHSWIDGSLRIGRTKSDYTGLANYDTTSTYYGVQVGAGKDVHVSENDTVGAYVRYAYAHTAGTSAHLSSGETFDFDAVNSHRLRIGTRYTHGATALSQFYAGLAWEYEFDGDARAISQGDSAPSPSLKGGSALLELGYRFAPQGSRMSYDLNLSGWQGKRKGITGGVSVKWAF